MMDGKTRATLLEQLRDGTNPLAWDEFFQRYWPLLFAYSKHRGCSDHTAEEIVQEVMVEVFNQRDLFHYDPARGRFRDWLAVVVRNKVAEHRRRPAQRVRAAGGDTPAMAEPAAAEPEPDAAWETAFENALLPVLLDVARREVNPRDFLAFELLAIAGLSGHAVARITGLSRNAAYKARRRLMERLRQLAGTYGDDGRLTARIREALAERPSPAVERSLSTRIEATMRSR
jgi:RNA polymerase sigma-70 factor (ECF subfamily)